MATFDVDTDGGGTYSSLEAALVAVRALGSFTEDNYITCTGTTVDTTIATIGGYTLNGYKLYINCDDTYVYRPDLPSCALILLWTILGKIIFSDVPRGTSSFCSTWNITFPYIPITH